MYGSNAKLLFTDTDSLCYEIRTKDFYQDMYDNKEMFDLSDVSATFGKGAFNDNTNKKVIGKFKPEYPNTPVSEFIGLRSKMYSIQFDNGNESKKAKGIGKSVIKKDLKHVMYKNILETGEMMRSKIKTIRSNKHQLIYLVVMQMVTVRLSQTNG